jgi:hypothetical protein
VFVWESTFVWFICGCEEVCSISKQTRKIGVNSTFIIDVFMHMHYTEATVYTGLYQAEECIDADWLGARLIGRWDDYQLKVMPAPSLPPSSLSLRGRVI